MIETAGRYFYYNEWNASGVRNVGTMAFTTLFAAGKE